MYYIVCFLYVLVGLSDSSIIYIFNKWRKGNKVAFTTKNNMEDALLEKEDGSKAKGDNIEKKMAKKVGKRKKRKRRKRKRNKNKP